jgi:GNAT superfamily N-acetyltransferase
VAVRRASLPRRGAARGAAAAPRAKSPGRPKAPAAAAKPRAPKRWRIVPLTRERWSDFTALFGEKGACAGCWCMFCRLPSAEYRALRPDARKAAMRRLAASTRAPGLLAYDGDVAVGWIAVGPREHFRRLETSRVMAPVDALPAWSAPCFFIARTHRGRGLQSALLEAASAWAARHGAPAIEGYPVDTKGRRGTATFLWTGLPGAFERAGFREVARRAPTRPFRRRTLARRGRRG